MVAVRVEDEVDGEVVSGVGSVDGVGGEKQSKAKERKKK